MDTLNLTKFQVSVLITLRVLIGWHLFNEGIVKLLNPNWSAAGYLSESKGMFSLIFKWIASNATTLRAVDFINQWALTIAGIFLIAGLFTRTSAYLGMVLLLLYYIALPPLIGYDYSMPAEGSYIIVNKTLIEACILLILALIPTGKYAGIDVLLEKIR